VAAKQKLTDKQVREIRRRHRRGESLTDLARAFGVNRKTLRRRIDAHDRVEAEQAARLAEKRLCWQAQRERRKLAARNEPDLSSNAEGDPRRSRARPPQRQGAEDGFERWLDTPKNLSLRALAEASGLVRLRHPDGNQARWVESSQADAYFDEGWSLDQVERR